MKAELIKLGLDALHYSGLQFLLGGAGRGMGVIFTLHHVLGESRRSFHPNRILEVTPDFLQSVIVTVRQRGFEIVSLDEACRRILSPANLPPFACFTFDDAARDIKTYAYPVLKRNNCPFTVYAATAFNDGEGEAWWLVLEQVIRNNDTVEVDIGGTVRRFRTADADEKEAAYDEIYWSLRRDDQYAQRRRVAEIAETHGVDMGKLCRDKFMDWADLRELATDPLVTIGAHSVNHYALAKLSEDQARTEMAKSVEIITDRLGRMPAHFAYPYGDPGSAGAREFRIAAELGFTSAVTTRKGMIHGEHRGHMTALPRVSLNGDYQSRRYLDLFLTGVPFLLWNGFRRLDVA